MGGSGSPSFLALTAGSGCQVEYLYSLVYQALDFIYGQKRAKQPFFEPEDGTVGEATLGPPRRWRISSCRWMTSLTPVLTRLSG